jgi:hypothetical protein
VSVYPYKARPVSELIPYARNARTHSDGQVAQIAASIREFGFINPVIIDGQGGIVAGHGRVMAARKLGLIEVPTLEVSHLTDAQRKAYILADNKLTLNAGWDVDLLKVELTELGDAKFDLELIGFSLDELAELFDRKPVAANEDRLSENYSRKIEAPIYEITGERPPLSALFDRAKADALITEINKAGLPDDVAEFLCYAANRHVVFNFRNIAEFYAHADERTQSLMERSALVIIDFNKAIEEGFVRLTSAVSDQYTRDYADA